MRISSGIGNRSGSSRASNVYNSNRMIPITWNVYIKKPFKFFFLHSFPLFAVCYCCCSIREKERESMTATKTLHGNANDHLVSISIASFHIQHARTPFSVLKMHKFFLFTPFRIREAFFCCCCLLLVLSHTLSCSPPSVSRIENI